MRAGAGHSVVAGANGAAREISRRTGAAIRVGTPTSAQCGTANALGPCGFSRGSAGGEHPGEAAAGTVSGASSGIVHNHGNGKPVGAGAVRGGKRFLLSPGFRICHPTLFEGAATGDGDPGGD